MKKLLILYAFILVLVGCGKDEPKPKMDHNIRTNTTVVIINNRAIGFVNVFVAKKTENSFKKLTRPTSIWIDEKTPEMEILDNSITEVYLFRDRADGAATGRSKYPIIIKPKYLNEIIMDDNFETVHISDKNDPAQYPTEQF
ncbi:hypothetical protein FACS1894180_5160 [Bacteroidia bacterium]|nr:hypothetical protein FACS1894180_5160 [Bacteroidia bacterium]